MTPDETQRKIGYLLDRQAIRDVVTDYCRGIDRFDRDLVLSVYHPDAMDDHSVFVGGAEAFWDFVRTMHGDHHHLTQHYVTNFVCEIDGAVAHAETYFLYAALNKEGAPFSLHGGRYIDRLEKRDGQWAIAERLMIPEWAAPAVNTPEGAATPEGGPNRRNLHPWQVEAASARTVGASRDRSDPSYARPLAIPPERKAAYDAIKAHASSRKPD